MALKQVIEIHELLDNAFVTAAKVSAVFRERGIDEVEIRPIAGPQGKTEFLKMRIPGLEGKSSGKNAPTLGIVGRLGGIGARPQVAGLVSDGDGAVAALSAALKIADMRRAGDRLVGDVIVSTHICPDAPVTPRLPVPFMGSPVDMKTLNTYEIDPDMQAILSIDTTKGNRVINTRGFAISPTVKEGYILKVSDDLLRIMEIVMGRMPAVLPITTQDITPYENGLFHVNSIMQPCVATSAPVVGVAITTESAVPGCATGASHEIDIEMAVRFVVEVSKAFGGKQCRFYDEDEFRKIVE
ncbi:MAG TPA: DUF1177 domain-containing protein, partial [Thermodesulfobacteriota bacterium]|nr:DUF1177 domain-containing protein [Thermodesulfobacteriota bacterium]